MNEQFDIVDWCNTALLAKKQIEADLRSATSKAEELDNAVKELKDQLEELIEAKKADESELLVKFRDLLNEKKVKIREQQRLLLANNVEPPETGAVHSPRRVARQTEKGHMPKPSRSGKRKAAEPEPDDDEEEEPVRVPGEGKEGEEDSDLEKMELDKRHGEEDSEADRTTDVDDDDETESDPDGDDDEPVPAGRKTTRDIEKPPAANTRHASQKKVETPPPPPRALPFAQRKAAAKPAPGPEPEGSETESDDEL